MTGQPININMYNEQFALTLMSVFVMTQLLCYITIKAVGAEMRNVKLYKGIVELRRMKIPW